MFTVPELAFRRQFPADLWKSRGHLYSTLVLASTWVIVSRACHRYERRCSSFLLNVSKQCLNVLVSPIPDSGDDCTRLPDLEEGTQSSANEHLRVAFCFLVTPPHTPVEELARAFHNNIAKAAGMDIQRQNSCLLSVMSCLDPISHRCAASAATGIQRSIAA